MTAFKKISTEQVNQIIKYISLCSYDGKAQDTLFIVNMLSTLPGVTKKDEDTTDTADLQDKEPTKEEQHV